MLDFTKAYLKYQITHWYQPIYQLQQNRIFGYEALMRNAASVNISPQDIFKEAEQDGNLSLLDLTSIKLACECFDIKGGNLFVNVFPSTLFDKNFIAWWDAHIHQGSPIVLELLEVEPIKDWDNLRVIIHELQYRGIKIAIDDLGMGYSFFQQWVELAPNFIKLDRYFAKNISTNLKKQKVLISLLELFGETTHIIVEGIEETEDLLIIRELGVRYVQGYLLGKPMPLHMLSLKGLHSYRGNNRANYI